jgi:hypothetical protein
MPLKALKGDRRYVFEALARAGQGAYSEPARRLESLKDETNRTERLTKPILDRTSAPLLDRL